LTGGDQRRRARGAAALAVAASRDADAGDGEARAGRDRFARAAERRDGFAGHRCCELQQRDIGAGAMTGDAAAVVIRMRRDAAHVEQLRLPLRVIGNDLGGGSRRHAMRGGEHDVRRDQRARAEIAARADNGDDDAAEPAFGRRRAADHGVSGWHYAE